MNFERAILLLAVSFFPVVAQETGVPELIRKSDALDKLGKNHEALALCLEAEKLAPGDGEVLRRVAKQYAEMVLDGADQTQKRALAEWPRPRRGRG